MKKLEDNDYFIFRIGVNKRKIGNIEEARAIFEKLMKKEISFKKRVLYEYGRILLNERKYDEIIKLTSSLDNKIPEILFLEGIVFGEKKEFDRSLKSLDDALKLNPDEYVKSGILSMKGRIHHSLKKYYFAIEAYQEAISINERLSDKLNEAINRLNLGNAYMCAEVYEKAEEEIQKAYRITRAIDNVEILKKQISLLSTIYIKKGKYEDGINLISDFEKKYGVFEEGIEIKRFYLHLFSGNFAKAKEIIKCIKNEEEIMKLKGYLAFFLCEFEDAIRYLNVVVEKDESAEFLLLLVMSYFYLGKMKEMNEIIKKFSPDETESLFEKGLIYLGLGLKKRIFLEDAERTFKLLNFPVLLGECYLIKGYFLIKEGKLKDGIDLILKGEELFKEFKAFGYLYHSYHIISDILKGMKKIAHNRALNMIEELISLIDRNDIYGILNIIKNYFGAERGAIILKKERIYESDVDEITISDLKEISKSVVKIARKGEILLSYDAEEDERFKDKMSVLVNSIKSILCVPMLSNGKVIGILYLDSTIRKNLFTEDDKDLLLAIGRILGILIDKGEVFINLKKEKERMENLLKNDYVFYGMVGISQSLRDIFKKVEEIAPLDINILITGETGTGKNMLAEIIHNLSKRKNEKFVTVECTSIPDELFESELFGHKKGSFTGAISDKIGLCETANGGTLFLDEIGDIPFNIQSKLLRLIEKGEMRRVGDVDWKKVNIRIISATNKDLESAVAFKEFRQDLYYRLKQFHIHIPPLRERIEDIPVIVEERIKVLNEITKKKIKGAKPELIKVLSQFPFPGNVRELLNMIDAMYALKSSGYLDIDDLMPYTAETMRINKDIKLRRLEEYERKNAIEYALRRTNYDLKLAAKILCISQRQLYRYIKKYNIKI